MAVGWDRSDGGVSEWMLVVGAFLAFHVGKGERIDGCGNMLLTWILFDGVYLRRGRVCDGPTEGCSSDRWNGMKQGCHQLSRRGVSGIAYTSHRPLDFWNLQYHHRNF